MGFEQVAYNYKITYELQYARPTTWRSVGGMEDSSRETIKEESSNGKKRHGCLTAYLVFMLIINSGTALVYLNSSNAIKSNLPDMPDWSFGVLIFGSIFNLVCAVALLQWKKWGFWGFTGSSCISFITNLYIGTPIVSACLGLTGIVILYGVLQIGDDNKGWTQLD